MDGTYADEGFDEEKNDIDDFDGLDIVFVDKRKKKLEVK